MEVMDFLRNQLARSDAWNCSTLVADWLIACGYPDYASGLRGVTDAAECKAIADGHGGLAELWESLFRGEVPWANDPPLPGDIAVVSVLSHEAGAIFTGERWALRQDHGLAFGSPEALDVVRAWRP